MMNTLCRAFLTFVFVIISAISARSQPQWTLQQTPSTTNLTRIIFVDTLKGWTSGDSGTVIHTTNGGTNWTLQNTGIQLKIDDLFFLNSLTGWALSNDYILGSYFFRTTNSGANWSYTRLTDSTHFYSSVFFNNANTGFLGGNEGRILKTTDAGSNWNLCQVDSSLFYRFPIQRMNFFNDRIGTASGGAFDIQGVVWQTTNGGNNWVSHGLGGEPIAKVLYKDSMNIIGIGGDHEFGASKVESTNEGATWTYTLLGIFGQGYAISMRNNNDIFVPLGYAQAFAKSSDGGRNWNSTSTPDSSSIYDVTFKDDRNGWCCGTNGKVYKYNVVVGVNTLSSIVPEGFQLYQNYPNPFNPVTKIKFQVPAGSHLIKLSIYDMLGKNVRTLIDNKLSAGIYEAEFNASELSSGIYYYTLNSDAFTETKKMILIK